MHSKRTVSITVLLITFLIISSFFSCNTVPSWKSTGNKFKASIVIYGDTRTDEMTHRKIVEAIKQVNPKFVFHTGDMVQNGMVEVQWNRFMQIISTLPEDCTFYPCVGNHEAGSPKLFELFVFPEGKTWYTVKVRNVEFFILDSNISLSTDSEQYRWFKQKLIESTSRFKIVITHHPPFSSGPHVEDEKNLRNSIVPLMEQAGVQAVFSGHDHCYERSLHNDTYYIVTGGGGAPLYDKEKDNKYSQFFMKAYHFCALKVHRKKINVIVYDENLNEIDRFSLVSDLGP